MLFVEDFNDVLSDVGVFFGLMFDLGLMNEVLKESRNDNVVDILW